jgi:hypothetical protein
MSWDDGCVDTHKYEKTGTATDLKECEQCPHCNCLTDDLISHNDRCGI